MIEPNGQIQEICQLNSDLDNITLFHKCLTKSDVDFLIKINQHFDVVLGLNVLYMLDRSSWDNIVQLFFKKINIFLK